MHLRKENNFKYKILSQQITGTNSIFSKRKSKGDTSKRSGNKRRHILYIGDKINCNVNNKVSNAMKMNIESYKQKSM